MNNEDIKYVWTPQPGPQTFFYTCPINDIMFGGARGGGKTFGMIGDMLRHAYTYAPHAKMIVFRRTYTELEDIINTSKEIYSKIDAEFSQTKLTWKFPFGGFLKFRHLDRDSDATKYQGHSYNYVGIEEMGNFPSPLPIDMIRATLRDPNNVPCRFVATANPGGVGHAWVKKSYVDPSSPFVPFFDQKTGLMRVFIPSKLSDNKRMSNQDQYAALIKGSGPDWLVAAWLNGDWNATPEGGMIKAAWLDDNRYISIPENADIRVHSWDTANKDKKTSDPSAFTNWAMTKDMKKFYLVECIAQKMVYPDLKRMVIAMAERDNPSHILIEDKSSGTPLIQDLLNDTRLPIIAIEPEADKYTRLFRCSGLFESGRVLIPESSAWTMEYVVELTTFPLAAHDDRVDSTSQFLNWAKDQAPDIQIIVPKSNRSFGTNGKITGLRQYG